MARAHRYGLAMAVTSAISFGFSGPFAKALITAGVSPLQAVWIRLGGAAVALLAVTAATKPRALVVPRHRMRFVALYSLVGFAAVQACYYGAVARLPVAVAVLIEYLSPVLVVAWVRLVRRVRVPAAAVLGAVGAVAGLAFVVQIWHGLRIDLPGLLLGIGTAGCAAAYFLLSQDTGTGVHPLGTLVWGLAGATLVLTPLARPWRLPWHLLAGDITVGGRTVAALPATGWLILVGTVTAYGTSIAALRRLSAAAGATVASLEVVASTLIAWALLGESLRPWQLFGGALVLTGALLAQRAVTLPARADQPSRVRRPSLAGQADRAPDRGAPALRAPSR